MKIKLQIPRILQASRNNELELEFDGSTMGDLLGEVLRQEPELY